MAVERKPLASQRYDMALAAAALVGAAAAALALRVIHAHGGFYMPAPNAQFVQGGTALVHNLGITAEGLLLLGGADFFGLRPTASSVFTMLHVVGVVLAAWGTWLAARRFLRDRDLVAQLLVAGVAINLAVYVLSTRANVVSQTREIAPVLPFGAALAGRLLAGRLEAAKLVPLLLVALLGYLAGLGTRDQPAAGGRAEPAAHLVAAGPASAHRPVWLLGVEHRHADQRRPDPDPGSETARWTAHPQHI